MTKKAVAFLEGLLDLNRSLENLLVDVVAAFSPWLAPVPVAIMGYDALINQLDLSPIAALAAAICIETLGLSAVQTAVSFRGWNADKLKSDPAAPFWAAAIATGAYVITVITLISLLHPGTTLEKVARAVLATLTIQAAVILSIRSSHHRRATEAKQDRERRRRSRRIDRPLAKQPTNGRGGKQEVLTR